jgi:phage/plasmid-associated DNA primase
MLKNIEMKKDKNFFDAINVNGEPIKIDLKTGEMHPREIPRHCTPDYHIERDIKYDPNIRDNFCEKVIRSLFPDDDDFEYIQKLFGYILTGETLENKMFVLKKGKIGEGQSVLIQMMSIITEKYNYILIHSNNFRDQTFLHKLEGKRLMIVKNNEIEKEEIKVSSYLVKEVFAACDPILCRSMYPSPKIIHPEWKSVFMDNDDQYCFDRSCGGVCHRIIEITPQGRLLDKRLLVMVLCWEALKDVNSSSINFGSIPLDILKIIVSLFFKVKSKIHMDFTSENISGLLNFAVKGANKWYADGLNKIPQSDGVKRPSMIKLTNKRYKN